MKWKEYHAELYDVVLDISWPVPASAFSQEIAVDGMTRREADACFFLNRTFEQEHPQELLNINPDLFMLLPGGPGAPLRGDGCGDRPEVRDQEEHLEGHPGHHHRLLQDRVQVRVGGQDGRAALGGVRVHVRYRLAAGVLGAEGL